MTWISVNDRLPDRIQRVLVYSLYQDVQMAVYSKGKDGQALWINATTRNLEQIQEVTHWMPISAIPKPEQKQ